MFRKKGLGGVAVVVVVVQETMEVVAPSGSSTKNRIYSAYDRNLGT